MGWPTPQAYNESLQHPQLAFTDPELRSGKPELNNLGIPRSISGNFACVYRLQCEQRVVAVRCFLRELPDQQSRYDEIAKHLKAAKLPFTVGFEFLPEGILVGGQRYPILKMEWVDGDQLHVYIQKHLHDPATLQVLATRWFEMLAALQRQKIAHGDLQHRNVLVTNGSLKLIDYDGMFVPSLLGEASHEIGHRNYQHPQRDHTHFDSTLDNFSAWVVYLSLVGLIADPSLRAQFNVDNEYLLLRREDFENPHQSSILTFLTKHPDPKIRLVANRFASFLSLGPLEVPPLNEVLSETPTTKDATPWYRDPTTVSATQTRDRARTSAQQEDTPSTLMPEDSHWVIDLLFSDRPIEYRSFQPRPAILRHPRLVPILVTTSGAVLMLMQIWPAVASTITWILLTTVIVGSGLVLRLAYSRDPMTREKRSASQNLRRAQERKSAIEAKIRSLEQQKEEAGRFAKRQRDRLLREKTEIAKRERRELDEITNDLRKRLRPIEKQREKLQLQLDRELKKIHREIGTIVDSLNRELDLLNTRQQQEVDTTLRRIQDDFVTNALQQHSVYTAPLPGTNRRWSRDQLIHNLLLHGIRTAYDVSYDRVDAVYGFGPIRTQALVDWRNRIASDARMRAPKTLPADLTNAIAQNYERRRRQLTSKRDSEQHRLIVAEALARDKNSKEQQSLVAAEELLRALAESRSKSARDGYAAKYKELDQRVAGVDQELAEKRNLYDVAIADERKKLFSADWEVAKAHREYSAFNRIRFRYFIRHVLLGR